MREFQSYGASKGNIEKKINVKGMKGHYDHWGVDGHIRDTYFKLYGYSNWYKDIKLKKSTPTSKVLFADTACDKIQDFVKG